MTNVLVIVAIFNVLFLIVILYNDHIYKIKVRNFYRKSRNKKDIIEKYVASMSETYEQLEGDLIPDYFYKAMRQNMELFAEAIEKDCNIMVEQPHA